MELIESGILTPFEVTFIDPGLFVQAWLYDTTTGVPVGPVKIAMTEITPGTYTAYFTPVAGKTYIRVDRVFTDGTYVTLDPNYPPNSEAAQSVNFGAISLSVLDAALSGHLTAGSVGAALQAAAYKATCTIVGKITGTTVVAAVVEPEPITGDITAPEVVAIVTDPGIIQC